MRAALATWTLGLLILATATATAAGGASAPAEASLYCAGLDTGGSCIGYWFDPARRVDCLGYHWDGGCIGIGTNGNAD